jgi:hypothetical protein
MKMIYLQAWLSHPMQISDTTAAQLEGSIASYQKQLKLASDELVAVRVREHPSYIGAMPLWAMPLGMLGAWAS